MTNPIVLGRALPSSDPGPAHALVAVTPSDSTEVLFRSVYVGNGGDISLTAVHDSAPVLLSAVPTGTILPIAVKRVNATNTTATLIVGLQ